MEEVEVVVAHQARVTLRVGAVFLKVDSDQARTEIEAEAMALAPIPTPEVLWRKPPVLAIAAVPGTALGRLGEPSKTSPQAWTAAGAALRRLHDAPLPPWPGKGTVEELAAELDAECAWLLANDVLPADLVARGRRVAETVLRPWTPAFTHGDLQCAHVFVDAADRISGVIDWSEAGCFDPLFDLAILTMGHPEHLQDVLTGYGADPEAGADPKADASLQADADRPAGADSKASAHRDVIRGWWSFRSLTAVRWLIEHGFDPAAPGCELDVLRRATAPSPARSPR
ncbi:MAG: aminoglycoside phosphotransferase family protein [Catenulispora sp.]|nr:aminoglycoside phosphotransferase family protein [Catenulispora sp.]